MRTTLSFFFLAMMCVSAHAADVTGTWSATFDTQVGQQSYTYEFSVEGSQLTGKATSANGETAIENGTVDGDTVTFVERINFQGMDLVITYTGEVVSDDEIRFKRDVSGFVVEDLVATRVR